MYGLVNFKGNHESISKYLPDHSIVISGISKWLGAGGWRFGYVIIPNSLREIKHGILRCASESFSSVSAPISSAVTTAYE
jgi:aspartate aminotransferase